MNLFRSILYQLNGWERVKEDSIPLWVNLASEKYFLKWGRPYYTLKHFKGKTFVYRVYYETAPYQPDFTQTVWKKKR